DRFFSKVVAEPHGFPLDVARRKVGGDRFVVARASERPLPRRGRGKRSASGKRNHEREARERSSRPGAHRVRVIRKAYSFDGGLLPTQSTQVWMSAFSIPSYPTPALKISIVRTSMFAFQGIAAASKK